jgi:hypothetical protein
MRNLNDILESVNVAVDALLWADDMERNMCREKDFPGLKINKNNYENI